MDRCIFAGGWSYWPGFFAQDVMRASAYKHINITSRKNNPGEFHLIIIDRNDNELTNYIEVRNLTQLRHLLKII